VLQQTTTVPTPKWARALGWLGLPAVGAVLLYLLLRAAAWMPLPGPFELIRELPETIASIVAAAAGAVIGLVLAGLADQESLTVRLTATDVVLTRPGYRRTLARADVAVAFVERDRLVLLGRTGRELAREPSHLSRAKLSAAFRAHSTAWSEQDPYLETYRRWVPDLPDVPAAAGAVFAARQTALRENDESDVKELREELSRLGFVVRDDHKRQYWRRVDG
jgi:hypothetical protein